MRLLGQEVHNRLLLAMPPATVERLRPALRYVPLCAGQTISKVNALAEHIYFINVGFVSIVKTMLDGRAVEVGGIGVEGVISPGSLFGINGGVFDAMVQLPGFAFQIRRETLRQEVMQDRALREQLLSYAHFILASIGQTAACNRLHSIEQRCCRWLLIAHDNAVSDQFTLTHELLAAMLGAQRAGVTVAARALKLAGLIDYRRGVVTILDRARLEEAACECHQASRNDYDRIFARHTYPPPAADRRQLAR
jgi:CRP-like cAMP-binding protein